MLQQGVAAARLRGSAIAQLTPNVELPMRRDRGFSLVELLAVVALLTIVLAIAAPVFRDVVDGMRLGWSARDLERELQDARLKAVSTNRRMRVRTNCPVAGQYRMVQWLNNASDSTLDRCSEASYPYPSTTLNVVTKLQDGPLRRLQPNVTVGTTTLEFWPNGTVHDPGDNNPLAAPATITLTKDSKTKGISVNGLGKIQLLP
jgi:prepilin-type N-terminal cleavage/methylation domain-containing protein